MARKRAEGSHQSIKKYSDREESWMEKELNQICVYKTTLAKYEKRFKRARVDADKQWAGYCSSLEDTLVAR